METLREREGGGCYSNGFQQTTLGPIGPSWRHQNQFFFSFILGPIRPKAIGQGGAQGAVGERVN